MDRLSFRVTCVPALRGCGREMTEQLAAVAARAATSASDGLPGRGFEVRAEAVVAARDCCVSQAKWGVTSAERGIVVGHVLCDIYLRRSDFSRTKMQIRVDVDDHIDSSEELMVRVEGVVQGSLDRYQDQVTRVEVHLSQRVPHRPGERDMCCRMEAHAGALEPLP